MGFLQKLWKDRISQFPKRYALKQQANGITQQVELELQDGIVQEGGDTFNAATMNDLEERIANAIDECGSGEDVSDLKDRTKTGSTDFYFDQKDGKYGWNSSKQRGADTFHPFNTIHTLIKTITSKTTTDLGEYHEYRTIDTTNVVNTNSGTYTFPANDTGGTKDLGASNSYRYVNAGNVYNKGKADRVVNLGVGQSFNVSGYSGYKSFSVNNFIIEATNSSASASAYGGVTYTGNVTTSVSGGTSVTKSYNASTGILTAYLTSTCSSQRVGDAVISGSATTSVRAYLLR